jgi:putative peptidoglycan lipid II flippase
MSVVAGSVAVAALARLSVEVAREDMPGARATLSRALEMTDALVLPAAVGLFLLAEPLIHLLFERGAFLPADTIATAGVLRMYALAVVGICLYRVLLPVFFALKDPYTPMKLSLAVMAVKVPLAWWLVYPLAMGVDGLPLSHAITVSAEVVAMLWILHRRLGGLAEGFWSQHMRMCAAAAAMGVSIWAVHPVLEVLGPLSVLASCALGGGVYLAAAGLLGVRTAREVQNRLLAKLLGRRP